MPFNCTLLYAAFPGIWSHARRLTIHQLEDVVEDKVLSARVARQLERLGVIHRALLLVDLENTGLVEECVFV